MSSNLKLRNENRCSNSSYQSSQSKCRHHGENIFNWELILLASWYLALVLWYFELHYNTTYLCRKNVLTKLIVTNKHYKSKTMRALGQLGTFKFASVFINTQVQYIG